MSLLEARLRRMRSGWTGICCVPKIKTENCRRSHRWWLFYLHYSHFHESMSRYMLSVSLGKINFWSYELVLFSGHRRKWDIKVYISRSRYHHKNRKHHWFSRAPLCVRMANLWAGQTKGLMSFQLRKKSTKRSIKWVFWRKKSCVYANHVRVMIIFSRRGKKKFFPPLAQLAQKIWMMPRNDNWFAGQSKKEFLCEMCVMLMSIRTTARALPLPA